MQRTALIYFVALAARQVRVSDAAAVAASSYSTSNAAASGGSTHIVNGQVVSSSSSSAQAGAGAYAYADSDGHHAGSIGRALQRPDPKRNPTVKTRASPATSKMTGAHQCR